MITKEATQLIKNSNCVVTGGAGFIGSNLVAELLGIGAKKVVVLDNFITGYRENLDEFKGTANFSLIEGSITNLDDCLKAFQGADVIFQMAALGSVPRSIDNPVATNEINVNGFLNVLEAARQIDIKRIVYSSSSSVYGDDETLPKVEHKTGNPLSPYAVTKKTNELYARTFIDLYGMDVIGLRYFNVFGPRQSVTGPYAAVIPIFLQNLLEGKPCYINGDGSISRDFTYVQNVVDANILASAAKVDLDRHVFNIAMGDQLSLNDLYTAIESHINSGQKPIHRKERQGDIRSSMADISRAKSLLGYQPSIPFSEGIKLTIDWFKSNADLNSI